MRKVNKGEKGYVGKAKEMRDGSKISQFIQ